MKKSDLFREIGKLEERYCDLVWYARSNPDEPLIRAVRERVEETYPNEVKALASVEGQWEHGFNSGCLAAFRLVLGMLGSAEDAEFAKQEFPFLDT